MLRVNTLTSEMCIIIIYWCRHAYDIDKKIVLLFFAAVVFVFVVIVTLGK